MTVGQSETRDCILSARFALKSDNGANVGGRVLADDYRISTSCYECNGRVKNGEKRAFDSYLRYRRRAVRRTRVCGYRRGTACNRIGGSVAKQLLHVNADIKLHPSPALRPSGRYDFALLVGIEISQQYFAIVLIHMIECPSTREDYAAFMISADPVGFPYSSAARKL
jgi:hypothetical protein